MTPNELRQAVRIVTTNANHPSTLNEVNETTRPTLSGSPGEMSRQGLTASVENEMALEEGLRIGRNREVCVADFASETVGFENSCQSNQTRLDQCSMYRDSDRQTDRQTDTLDTSQVLHAVYICAGKQNGKELSAYLMMIQQRKLLISHHRQILRVTPSYQRKQDT